MEQSIPWHLFNSFRRQRSKTTRYSGSPITPDVRSLLAPSRPIAKHRAKQRIPQQTGTPVLDFSFTWRSRSFTSVFGTDTSHIQLGSRPLQLAVSHTSVSSRHAVCDTGPSTGGKRRFAKHGQVKWSFEFVSRFMMSNACSFCGTLTVLNIDSPSWWQTVQKNHSAAKAICK